jgi:hypothetical protein
VVALGLALVRKWPASFDEGVAGGNGPISVDAA